MCRRSVIVAASVPLLAALLGCGLASQPLTVRPEAARAGQKASSPRQWVEVRSGETSAPLTAVVEEEPEHARSPAEVLKGLTDPAVAFMVDYVLSDAHREAVASCVAVVGEGKRAECASRARAEFAADAIRFKDDGEGQLWWLVYRRRGDELVETHNGRIELSEVTADRVTMTILGPQGARPLFRRSSRVVIGVPDEYSIEIEDPELGRLVYDAKVGLVR